MPIRVWPESMLLGSLKCGGMVSVDVWRRGSVVLIGVVLLCRLLSQRRVNVVASLIVSGGEGRWRRSRCVGW